MRHEILINILGAHAEMFLYCFTMSGKMPNSKQWPVKAFKWKPLSGRSVPIKSIPGQRQAVPKLTCCERPMQMNDRSSANMHLKIAH